MLVNVTLFSPLKKQIFSLYGSEVCRKSARMSSNCLSSQLDHTDSVKLNNRLTMFAPEGLFSALMRY